MFSTNPNYTKLKTHLRLAINRLKLLEKKKTELAQKARKEIAEYIAGGKVERAKIRVEHIIREDYMVEAMEIVEMYCDLILARYGLITQMKELDEGLAEAVSCLIWVAPRMHTDVQELKVISDLLTAKYGKIYADACRNESVSSMNDKLKHKLSVQSPPKILVERYLIEIAKNYNVEYTPDEQVMREEQGRDAMLIDVGDPQPPGFIGYPNFPIQPPQMPQLPQPFVYPTIAEHIVTEVVILGYTLYVDGKGDPKDHHAGPLRIFRVYDMLDRATDPTLHGPSGGKAGGFIATPPPPSYGGGTSKPTASYQLPPGAESKDLSNSFLQEEMHNLPPAYDSIHHDLPNIPVPQPRSKPPTTNQFPELPELPTVPSDLILPSVPNSNTSNTNHGGPDEIDFEDLNRRFEELKKKK